MFILKIWSFVKGYLLLSISRPRTERFLNMAVKRGLSFWDLHYRGEKAYFKLRIGDFNRLRPLARKTGCRVKVECRVGLPFILRKLRRRRGLVVGAFFFIAAIYFFSSFVWFIEITGGESVPRAEVWAILEDQGVYPGVLKSGVDLHALEQQLVADHPAIVWAGVSMQGTLLRIEIAERVIEPEISHEPADLVASKDGLITDILVLSGEAAVAPGDTVAEGDVLIRGVIRPLAEGDSQQAPPLQEIRARGIVEARVWYEGYGEALLQEVAKERTGRRSSAYILRVDGVDIPLWDRKTHTFRNYEIEKVKRGWRWRNIYFPVELLIERIYEVDLVRCQIPYAKATEKARRRALQQAWLQVPPEAEVVSWEEEVVDLEVKGRVARCVTIEVKENIAAPRERSNNSADEEDD